MAPKFESVPFVNLDHAGSLPAGEELREHGCRLRPEYYLRRRVFFDECLDGPRMIRLQVMYHQIVRLPAVQSFSDIVKPQGGLAGIYGIDYGELLVVNEIRIVGYSLRHRILALEESYIVVIHAYVED